MSINKIQGQSVTVAHGQLYVALSRCTSASNVKILFPEHAQPFEERISTSNVVYPEVLIHRYRQ